VAIHWKGGARPISKNNQNRKGGKQKAGRNKDKCAKYAATHVRGDGQSKRKHNRSSKGSNVLPVLAKEDKASYGDYTTVEYGDGHKAIVRKTRLSGRKGTMSSDNLSKLEALRRSME
jgi:hypothetical protein